MLGERRKRGRCQGREVKGDDESEMLQKDSLCHCPIRLAGCRSKYSGQASTLRMYALQKCSGGCGGRGGGLSCAVHAHVPATLADCCTFFADERQSNVVIFALTCTKKVTQLAGKSAGPSRFLYGLGALALPSHPRRPEEGQTSRRPDPGLCFLLGKSSPIYSRSLDTCRATWLFSRNRKLD